MQHQKELKAENNLDISISDFETVVGRKPDINWFESDKTKINFFKSKGLVEVWRITKIPSTLEQSIDTGLKKILNIFKL